MVVRKFAGGRRFVWIATAFGLALVATLAVVSGGQAGSTRTATTAKISPHVLTAGQQGFITVTFTNSGPSTVNHVVATVHKAVLNGAGEVIGTEPLPLSVGDFAPAPANCSVVPSGSVTLTCDFGQVKPGIRRRVFSFTAPATVAPFNVHVTTTFDESKGGQLTDTVTGLDPYPFSIVSGTNPAVKGVCTAAANELAASNGPQGTSADPPALDTALFPCTPLSVGVDSVKHPNNVPTAFGDISFIDFLGDGGLATVKVFFFDLPDGVNKNDVQGLYELARFPIDLTATNNGASVPDCVKIGGEFQIPNNSDFVSCVLGEPGNLPGGGLVFTLLAEGGEDSGWGGY